MATAKNGHINELPERYRQAREDIEAAGGSVSDFAKDLVIQAEQKGMSDKEIIKIMKDHYQED